MNLKIKKIHTCTTILLMLLLNVLLFSILAVGCSRAARHRTLRFFFDEVPPLSKPDSSSAVDSLAQSSNSNGNYVNSSHVKTSNWFSHPKPEKGECTTCHDRKQIFRLYDVPEKLCLNCHDQAEAEFVHAPVEGGECLSCHNPHGTRIPHLLVMESKKLCFQCHYKVEIKPADAISLHSPVDKGTCDGCHDSHGSKYEAMLKESDEKLCYLCHDKAKVNPVDAKFVHAPVDEGACTTCHSPHWADSPHLLVESKDTLCFQCHDEDLKSLEVHKGIEEMVCYDCHNPHSSDNEYFIR